MKPFYRFDRTGGNPGRSQLSETWAVGQPPITRRRYKNHITGFAQTLTCGWSIGPIRSNDLPVEPSRLKLPFMTVSLAAACFVLLAAVLHFVSYKLRKTAERKAFRVKDAT
jgi:hypothetical protein